LHETILTGGGVDHQNHFLWCIGNLALHDFSQLLEFGHQVVLGMQPPGGIHDQHIDVPGVAACMASNTIAPGSAPS
jgi:hypothetical protein